jgi:hypothetical protein
MPKGHANSIATLDGPRPAATLVEPMAKARRPWPASGVRSFH